MRMLAIVAILSAGMLLVLACGCTGTPETPSPDACEDARTRAGMLSLLPDLQGRVNGELGAIDAAASGSARDLGSSGLSGPAADTILDALLEENDVVRTAIVINRTGIVTAARPDSAAGLIGVDLSYQPFVAEAFATRQPILTGLVPLVEGGFACLLEYPVFDESGTMIGIASLSFQPADLVRPLADEVMEETPYTMIIVQPDGVTLYDPDPGEIGRNTLTDPLYAGFPEIQEIARRAEGNWSGSGSYRFAETGSNTIVQKETFWTTTGIHGTEWRLFITRTTGA
jgi:hypothetical protein